MLDFNDAPLQSDIERQRSAKPIDFYSINQAALAVLPSLLSRWLPDGLVEGREYTALNPRRPDLHHGSFKINLHSGKWSDFAISGVSGSDVISLAAYLFNLRPSEVAKKIADMLNVR